MRPLIHLNDIRLSCSNRSMWSRIEGLVSLAPRHRSSPRDPSKFSHCSNKVITSAISKWET